MKLPPLPPPQLLLLQTLSHEISNLYSTRVPLPTNHPVLKEDFDPDKVIKPVLSTYYPQFLRLFGEGEYVEIWIGFNGALLRVWEWGDVEMAVDGFWEGVGRYFVVRKEDITSRSSLESL
ncbi:hypothetical protein TWF718_010956 [Orbilia javanica]|uniref:Uncharacterized protein n=1 Tax=Orbilia javanica TaxID=47235 RepID=A0AAN8RC38_9PEZI